jgi:hypothetical protein
MTTTWFWSVCMKLALDQEIAFLSLLLKCEIICLELAHKSPPEVPLWGHWLGHSWFNSIRCMASCCYLVSFIGHWLVCDDLILIYIIHLHCAVNRVDYLYLWEPRELPGLPILQMVVSKRSQCKDQLIPLIQQDQVPYIILIELIWMSNLG